MQGPIAVVRFALLSRQVVEETEEGLRVFVFGKRVGGRVLRCNSSANRRYVAGYPRPRKGLRASVRRLRDFRCARSRSVHRLGVVSYVDAINSPPQS